MDKAFFISGTDTGCGKTLAAESLLIALGSRGLMAAGMKPVATGAEVTANGLVNGDVVRLQKRSTIPLVHAEINPYCFNTPCSPNFAAETAGVEIGLEKIETAFRQLALRVDIIIVEGIGGWRVPLSARLHAGDIARQLKLPVIFVTGLKLGCINHTLLSIEAIAGDGIPLKGWIANYVDPGYTTGGETIDFLRSRIAAPLLGVFPCSNNHSVSGEEMWENLDVSALL